MHPSTRAIHAGLPTPAQGEPLAPGPVFASVFRVSGDPATSSLLYGRYHNPTWMHLEGAIAELEGGDAVLFASGIAAVHAVLATTLHPGDTLLMPSDGYYAARRLAHDQFGAIGVKVREYRTRDLANEPLDGVALLWIETPCNPVLDVCDIRAAAARVHAAGGRVAVDNTTPTPLGQAPLSLGADYSVAADTKAFSGHSDLLLGHVACGEPAAAERLRSWRTATGAIAGPMEAWLAHRSLATLELRLERASANALALAGYLGTRPDVHGVRYPGLPADPSHEIARGQMRHFGPILGFELESAERADRFLQACRLVTEATSFGGVHSTAERRARWGGDDVAPGFIRFSAGCEHVDDLLADVRAALDA